MLSRQALLHILVVRERQSATAELSVHALAHELDMDVEPLEDELDTLARRGLVTTYALALDGVSGAVPCVRVTTRGRERVLAVN